MLLIIPCSHGSPDPRHTTRQIPQRDCFTRFLDASRPLSPALYGAMRLVT